MMNFWMVMCHVNQTSPSKWILNVNYNKYKHSLVLSRQFYAVALVQTKCLTNRQTYFLTTSTTSSSNAKDKDKKHVLSDLVYTATTIAMIKIEMQPLQRYEWHKNNNNNNNHEKRKEEMPQTPITEIHTNRTHS